MANLSKIPWDIGSVFICSKCGTKFNQPNLADEVKSEVRKMQKADETQGQIRVIVSGCLGVCYPEKQTIGFMPVNGPTELYTTELNKDVVAQEVKDLLATKLGRK